MTPADAHSEFLAGRDIKLHAKVWRQQGDEPAMLILHGIFESWRTFAPYAARLLRRRSAVYCLDLRGHGASQRPSHGYTFADYTNDVLAVLDDLGDRAGAIDVLGHSLGANVALFAAAARHPAIRKVIAVDPPILLRKDWPSVRAGMRHSWELARRPVARVARELATRSDRDPAWLRMIAEALTETADGVFAAMVHGEQSEVDWPATLSPITAPVLALAADPAIPGAQLTGDRLAEFQRSVPHATIIQIPGAGHHIEVDRPAQFLRAVYSAPSAGLRHRS